METVTVQQVVVAAIVTGAAMILLQTFIFIFKKPKK